MSNHTPAPWTYNSAGEVFHDGEIIAQVYDNPGEEQAEANIPLIAAAPELLEACQDMIRFKDVTLPKKTLELARAAIAKATAV